MIKMDMLEQLKELIPRLHVAADPHQEVQQQSLL
jgi:hypothetical protein